MLDIPIVDAHQHLRDLTQHGYPWTIRVENGSGFISRDLYLLAYVHGATTGKLTLMITSTGLTAVGRTLFSSLEKDPGAPVIRSMRLTNRALWRAVPDPIPTQHRTLLGTHDFIGIHMRFRSTSSRDHALLTMTKG